MKTIKHSFLQNLISGALFAAVLGVTNPAYAYAPQNPQLGAISYAATYTNNGAFTLPGGNTTFYFDVHWMALDDYATVLLSGPINIAVYNSVGTQVASLQQVAGQLINPPTLTQPTCAPGTASTTWTGSQMESWGKVQWTLNLPSGNYTYTVLTYKTYIVGYNATTTCNFCSGFPFYGSGGSAVAQGIKFNSIPDQWAGATVTLNGSGLDQPYYRSTYSDLNAAFGSNVNQYWSHWQGSGYTEGRSPYAGSTAAGAAYSQSGMPVVFTVASGPATLSGNTLTFTGAGKVVIAANAPGGVATNSVTFKPASASVTFNVNAMYRIGSQNSQDNTTWGPNRFYGFNPSLVPGSSRTATFNLTAPATAGSYNFQTKIVADGVEWFGDQSTNAVIKVANLPTATITPSLSSIATGSSSTITATFNNDSTHGDYLTSSYIDVVSPSGTETLLTGASSIVWTPTISGTYTFKAYMATTLTQPAKSFAICTVTVTNSPPTVAVTINSSTFNAGARTSGPAISLNFGQSATVTINAADADGNGTSSYFIHDNGNNTQWLAAPAGSAWSTDTAAWSSISGSSFTTTGTFTATFTPQFVPSAQTFYRVGGSAFDSTGAKTQNYGSITVNKATPSGTFADQTFVYGTTLTAGMLNASFSNTDSATVSGPSGAVTYSVQSIITNPGAATPAGTVLNRGDTLNAGKYTIAATCAADGNYIQATATATFTVTRGSISATPTISANPNPVNSGNTTVITPSSGTTGNYSWTLNGTVISNGPGGVWAPASGTYANGSWSISGNNLSVVPNSSATSFTTAFTDTGDFNRSGKTSLTLTVTVNRPPVVTFDGVAGDGTMPNAGYVSSTMNFWGTASDPDSNLSRVDIYVDGTVRGSATISGGNWTFNKTAASMSLGIGSHTTQAIAYDSLGATTSTGTPSFTINNRAPGVPTATVTSIDYRARIITVQVTGTDPDANLDMLYLQVRGPNTDESINWTVDLSQSQSFSLTGGKTINFLVPFAGGPSGSGTGTYWFSPIGLDQPDWADRTDGTAITAVVDRDPAVAFSASPTSINFGQTTTLTSTATDPDGVLNFHGILALMQDGSNWLQPVGVDYSSGSVNGEAWGNFSTTTDFVSASFTNGIASGASHTETAVHRPSFVGQVTYHSNANDGIDWESSNAPAAYAYVTVNKSAAQPNGFSDQTFNYGTLLTAGMLNAAWENPYTALVTQPTASATYNATGYGAVAVGTKLPPGVYTVKATYSGDANYQSGATQSATFTVNPDPLLGSFDSGLNTGRNHDYFFMSGDAAQINGWAYSPDSTSPGTPKLYIDGALISSLSTIPGARPDLAALGTNAVDSGFSTAVTLSGLSIGTHTFSVTAFNAWTSTALLPYAAGGNTGTFTICPPTPSQTVNVLAGGNPISDGGTFYYGQKLTMTNLGSAPAGYISENDVGWRFNGGAYSNVTGTTFDGGVTWQVFTAATAATTSSTRTVTLTPPSGFGTYGLLAEVFTGFPTNTRPLGGNGSQVGSYPSFTYAKASPVGTFAARTLTPAVAGSPSYTVASGDLNATFANPYTGSVTQPTGTPVYTIAPSSPTGTSGALINSTGSTLISGSTYVIRATYQGDSLYNSGAVVDSTWTINKASQTAVSINSAATATYGTTYTATATGGNGGGSIVWGLGVGSTASGAAIDSTTGIISAKSTGTVVINAYRASDANYLASATTSNFTITVGTRPITITLSGSKAYDTTTVATGAATNITTGTLAPGDSIGYVYGALSSANLGTYLVNVGLSVTPTITNGSARTSSYAITYAGSYSVNQATQPSVNITSASTTVYGNPYTATATGGAGSGALVWTINAGSSTAAGAAIDSATGVITANSTGQVVFTAYRAADANYLQSATTANFTVTVTSRPITVTLSGSKTYDGTTASTGASAAISSGTLAPGDSIGYAIGALPNPSAAIYNVVSDVTVSPTISNATAPNSRTSSYAVTYNGTITVNPLAITVTLGGSKPYDGNLTATGASSNITMGSLAAGDSIAYAYGVLSSANVGPYLVNVGLVDTPTITGSVAPISRNSSYVITYLGNFSVTKINQPAVSITSAASTTYGTAYTATAIGGAGGGALTWALGSGSTASGAAIDSVTGVVTANSTGTVVFNVYRGMDTNYNQSATTADFTVTFTPRPITITLSGSKIFDGNPNATGASASVTTGTLGTGDSIAYAYGFTNPRSAGSYLPNVGVPVTPTISSATAPVSRTSNYTITYAGSYTITQRPITITLAGSKTYDGTTTATGASASITTGTLGTGGSITYAYGALSNSIVGTYQAASDITVTPTIKGLASVPYTSSYNITYTGSFAITKADQPAVSITSAATATYGTTYTATASGGAGTGALTWALGVGSTASGAAIDPVTGVVTANSTGTVVFHVYRGMDTNYNQSATTGDFTVTVGARPITVTLAGSKTYDGTTTATGASASITLGSLGSGDSVTYAFGTLPSANAGSYPVTTGLVVTPTITGGTAPLDRTSNYAITYAGLFLANQAPQPSVNITSASTSVYGNPYTATATGGTGSGAIVWTINAVSSTAAGAAIDSATGVITANSTGTVVFTAYRAAETNYLPSATTSNFTLPVNPRPITVTLTGSKPYDTTTVATGASASITSGTLAPGDSIGYAYGSLPSANVATYPASTGLTVTPTVSNATAPLTRTSSYTVTYAGNYVVTLANQPAVTITSANSIPYGTAYTATATGGAGSGFLTWTLNAGLSTAAGASMNPVTGAVTYNSTGTLVFNVFRGADTNYNQSATTANFTVTINACPITVTLTGSKTYDGTTGSTGASANITSGSLAVGDAISYAIGALSSPVAGTYPIATGLPVTPTITNSMAPLSRTSNYTITYAGNFVINPKSITVTLAGSKNYDTTTVATGASASISSGTLAASDSIAYAYGALSSAIVGTYPVATGLVVTPTVSNATTPFDRTGSYTIAYLGNFSVIKGTQSAVTINSGATVPYGTAYTATATGGNGGGALQWALGSGSTVPGAAIDPATGAVTANSAGTVVFNVTRAGDSNYNPSATTANFTLTVTPLPITITLAGSKPYDTTTVATGASASITSGSLAAGDSIAYAYGALSSANAGTYPVTTGLVVTPTVTNAVVPFTRTSSYTVTYLGNFSVTKINQPAVSITSAASTTYGTAYTATAIGGTGGGSLTWTLGSGSTASGAAIDSATGVVTANSTGTVAFHVNRGMDTNYNQSATTADFTVTFTPRPITITLSGSKPYDGTTASTGASASITSGTLGIGDSIAYAYGLLSSPLAGVYNITTGLPVTPTISNATAPLSRASNYTITYLGSFTVNPIAITITLAGSKPYDTTTVATGASASITSGSLAASDSIAYAYGALSGSIVGTYPVTSGLAVTPTVTSATAPITRTGSYTISYAGSFSVTKGTQAAVTITSAATATYGTAYTATATGGTGGGFPSWGLGVGSTASGAAIDSVSGTITANSTGTVVIHVFRGGDSNYLASATTADFTVTVGARPITITLAGSKTYDATTVATGASATMTSGTLAPGDSIGYAYGALPSANAATYLVTTDLAVTPTITSGTAPLNRTSNYTITYAGNYKVTKADQTSVTITSASTITYGNPYTATATGGTGSGALVWTINAVSSTAAGAAIDSATGVITANSTGQVVFTAYRALDTNYNQSATTANFTVIINNRPITVTLTGSKPYDTTTVATGASASITSGTLAPGDSIGYAYGSLPSANVATYPASTGLTVTPTVSNATAPVARTSNYTVTYAGNYVVTLANQPAVTITSANSIPYGTAYIATATGGAGSGFLTWTLNAGLSTAAGASMNSVNGMVTYNSTGTLVFNVFRGADTNYNQSATTANFTVTINACPITVTLTGSMTYDGTTASTGASASVTSGSLAVGDAISYALGVLSSPVAGTYPITTGLPVTPTITNSMAPLSRTSNYAITYAGNFIVSPKPITISLAGSKPYDTTTVATGASASISSGTLIAGDSIGYAYGPLSSAIVGTYLPTTGLVVTPTVTNATTPITRTGSYTFTFAGSYTVNKGTQAALTITSANGFNYGDAYTATATGGSGGGVIQWALGFGSTANSASIGLISGSVGACSAGTVVINAYRLGDSNYNQSAPTADFTVTVAARPITVTLAGSKVYDTTTASTGASASVTTGTLAAGDTIAFAYGSLSSANGGIYPVTTGLVVTPTASNLTAPMTRTGAYVITYAGSFSVTQGTQAPVSITSAHTAVFGSGYAATASGGSGSGVYSWSLGTGSTALAASINSSTGAIQSTGLGTIVIKVQRVADTNYSASAWSADFSITLTSPPPAVLLSVASQNTIWPGDTITLNITASQAVGNVTYFTWRLVTPSGTTGWSQVNGPTATLVGSAPYSPTVLGAYEIQVNAYNDAGGSTYSSYDFNVIQGVFSRSVTIRAEPAPAMGIWFTTSPGNTQSITVNKTR